MPHVLGVDIGATSTVAAVARRRGVVWARPEVARLGGGAGAVASVVHLSANGSLSVGAIACGDGEPDGSRIARDFCRRIGDDVPLLLGGEPCAAQTLTAVLAMWVVEQVAAQEREFPEAVVISHPADWGPHRVELLYRALHEIGLDNATLLPQPVTVAEGHAARGFTGRTAVVYALGGTSFECALVRRTRRGIFETFGSPQRLEPLGGNDFDEALDEHVRGVLRQELGRAGDPQIRFASHGLVRECERAKRDLSLAPQTDVVVQLPAGPARIPVTRTQFEEMIRPVIQATVDTVVWMVRSAGMAPDQLDGVLLAGGSVRIPLVTEMLATRFPGMTEIETDPQATAAIGAALAASQIVSPQRTPRSEARRATTADGDVEARSGAMVAHEETEPVGPPPRPLIRITTPDLPKSIWLRLGTGRKRLAHRRTERVG